MTFPYNKLFPELQSMVDSHIEDLGVDVLRKASLVSKQWATTWIPKAHREVILESYTVSIVGEESHYDGREFHDLLYQLTDHAHIRQHAHRIVFRGPCLTRRVELAVDDVTASPGVLTPCSVREALGLLPHVDSIAVEDVTWDDCPLLHGVGWNAVGKRAFKTISFTEIDNIATLASPFVILRAAHTVDELVLGFMDTPRSAAPRPEDISGIAIRRVVLQNVAASGSASFDLLSTMTNDTIRDLDVLDMGNQNIAPVALLLQAHAQSLGRLCMSFHTIDSGTHIMSILLSLN